MYNWAMFYVFYVLCVLLGNSAVRGNILLKKTIHNITHASSHPKKIFVDGDVNLKKTSKLKIWFCGECVLVFPYSINFKYSINIFSTVSLEIQTFKQILLCVKCTCLSKLSTYLYLLRIKYINKSPWVALTGYCHVVMFCIFMLFFVCFVNSSFEMCKALCMHIMYFGCSSKMYILKRNDYINECKRKIDWWCAVIGHVNMQWILNTIDTKSGISVCVFFRVF